MRTRLLALLIGLCACGDDVTIVVDGGADASTDGGSDASDASGSDSGSDAGTDAPIDAPSDAGSDASVDSGVDAPIDAMPDAGSCGAGPACGPDETCWGEGCSCILEIDGDSYLRTDGAVVYYANSPQVLAETAPGVILPLRSIGTPSLQGQ